MTHPEQPQQQQEQQQEPQPAGAEEEEEYERALAALSGLISGRQRRDSGMWAHAFEMMQSYLEVRPATPDHPSTCPLVAAQVLPCVVMHSLVLPPNPSAPGCCLALPVCGPCYELHPL
jgi:hypothetical protein